MADLTVDWQSKCPSASDAVIPHENVDGVVSFILDDVGRQQLAPWMVAMESFLVSFAKFESTLSVSMMGLATVPPGCKLTTGGIDARVMALVQSAQTVTAIAAYMDWYSKNKSNLSAESARTDWQQLKNVLNRPNRKHWIVPACVHKLIPGPR
jgi:hypothetical protein